MHAGFWLVTSEEYEKFLPILESLLACFRYSRAVFVDAYCVYAIFLSA